MDIKEFSKIMQYMNDAYEKTLNENTMAVWYDFFKRYDTTTFKNGVIQAINQCKFYPTIAELKEIIAYQITPQIGLNGEKEWEKVRYVAQRIGRYKQEEALAQLEPITRDIVRRIGYEDICNADEGRRYNLRSAFLKAFENEKQELIKYNNAVKNDTEDMLLIQERNRELLGNITNGLIKRIDYEK